MADLFLNSGAGSDANSGLTWALAKATLAEADIAAGRLVRLFSTEVPVNFAYYIVAPKSKLNLPKVSYFRDWLLAQVTEAQGKKPVFLKDSVNSVAA